MSSSLRRVFSGLTRSAVSRGTLFRDATSTVRLNSKRLLTLSSQAAAKPTDDEMEMNSEPIKFSTSKASPTKWKVDQSLGSHHQRPWWNAFPIAVVFISVLLWCCLREETDIDGKLGEHLLNKLPGLLPDEEEDENKPS